MKEFLLLISMIFCHVLDDYRLQGILAKMKQKSWWMQNYPESLYKYDYIPALMFHAFSWTFMIHIPVFVYMYYTNGSYILWKVVVVFIITMLIHAYIDHLKANKHKISLVTDQLIHLIQIVLLFLLYM